MYAALTEWLGQHDFTGKRVVEYGGSNSVLARFVLGARVQSRPYPDVDVHDLNSEPKSYYDLVILDMVLEHLRDPERALAEIYKVLAPGGVLIVTTVCLYRIHTGRDFGDYHRWTPEGLQADLVRCGFSAEVGSWGNLAAAQELLAEPSVKVSAAPALGLDVEQSDPVFPISLWAVATKPGDLTGAIPNDAHRPGSPESEEDE